MNEMLGVVYDVLLEFHHDISKWNFGAVSNDHWRGSTRSYLKWNQRMSSLVPPKYYRWRVQIPITGVQLNTQEQMSQIFLKILEIKYQFHTYLVISHTKCFTSTNILNILKIYYLLVFVVNKNIPCMILKCIAFTIEM